MGLMAWEQYCREMSSVCFYNFGVSGFINVFLSDADLIKNILFECKQRSPQVRSACLQLGRTMMWQRLPNLVWAIWSSVTWFCGTLSLKRWLGWKNPTKKSKRTGWILAWSPKRDFLNKTLPNNYSATWVFVFLGEVSSQKSCMVYSDAPIPNMLWIQ